MKIISTVVEWRSNYESTWDFERAPVYQYLVGLGTTRGVMLSFLWDSDSHEKTDI
jgi:hypothetical protein